MPTLPPHNPDTPTTPAPSHDTIVIAVDMGGTKIAGALVDRRGYLTERRTAPTWPEDGGLRGLDALVAVITDLRAASERRGTSIHAVSVSVAGVVRHETGFVQLAPNLQWYDFPLRSALVERTGLPVVLGNDGKLATLGEYHAGAGAGAGALVGVWIGTGVGGGIVLNGQLLHGAQEAAGEMAYMLPDRHALAQTFPDLGALEILVAGPGIARRAEIALVASPNIPSRLRNADNTLQALDVFAAARMGDEIAGAIMDETLDYLALMLANASVILDPHRIVVGGSVGLALAPWYEAIRERMNGRIPHVPPLIAAALGGDAPLVGAAALAWGGS